MTILFGIALAAIAVGLGIPMFAGYHVEYHRMKAYWSLREPKGKWCRCEICEAYRWHWGVRK